MNWKKWSFLLALPFVLSIFLVACGVNNKDNESDSNNESAEDADLADEQELNINIKEEPPSLHPGKASDTTSSAVLDQVFEGLTRIDQDTDEHEEAMAGDIYISDDEMNYTFNIRDDAEWSNGDAGTAEYFEYAWRCQLDLDNADTDYAYQLYLIKVAEDAKENDGDMYDVGSTVD